MNRYLSWLPVFLLISFNALAQKEEDIYPLIHFQKNSSAYLSYKATEDSVFFKYRDTIHKQVPDTLRPLFFITDEIKQLMHEYKDDSNYFFLITGYSNLAECKDTTLEYLRMKKVFDFLTAHGIPASLITTKCYRSKKGAFPNYMTEKDLELEDKYNMSKVQVKFIDLTAYPILEQDNYGK